MKYEPVFKDRLLRYIVPNSNTNIAHSIVTVIDRVIDEKLAPFRCHHRVNGKCIDDYKLPSNDTFYVQITQSVIAFDDVNGHLYKISY